MKGFLILLALAGGFVIYSHTSGSESRQRTWQAIGMAREAVKNLLVSPGSASFGPDSVNYDPSGSGYVFDIAGVVDSQNRFGVTMRAGYTCKAYVYDGNGRDHAVCTLK